ncbi:glutamate-5-semialdehyde dehydrogenase [Parvularcula sp. IMCC14364]|uniref:glutamate-5-semialdehyde dehydrogenase n=1 Tax=Parvularcula sp. IMCC14364 TaxID=3067902 RepID=UPI002741A937|nr:glutamate-5-semialdehyde dehydrogenase [Parvularcula sp. IMCC14364]
MILDDAQPNDLPVYMDALATHAQSAAQALATATSEKKSAALLAAATAIQARADELLQVNSHEVAAASERGQQASFVDRMQLSPARIDDICESLKKISALPDPVGQVIREWSVPSGLKFERLRTPIGVIAVIYESRPNVTVDAAALAVKSGNAVILRGGSECIETAKILHAAFREGLIAAGLPAYAAQIVETPDRDAVGLLLGGLENRIDLVIPRGGKSLVSRIQTEARVPVLSHLDGICHVYLDKDADLEKAVSITLNSKMRRTGVCGAAETLLIDRARLHDLLPPVIAALKEAGCELRGDHLVLEADNTLTPAIEMDWHTEYLSPILSVAAVDGVVGAISHIRHYSSGHTEAIVTENEETAHQFLTGVDSAIVLHNASTQFADGGEFGMGAEIGIATGRLHARGPVGLEELTTYKTVVRGSGHIRP